MLGFMDAFPWYMDKNRNFMLYRQDSLEALRHIPDGSVDLIFADPPYFLSNGGMTCKSGRRASVDKGSWDKSMGAEANHEYNLTWLRECKRILKADGTMFVSGTHHVIFSIGYAMQQLDMKILNDITWHKTNPPPNLSCRYFTHSTETIIWAAPHKKSKHFFDYHSMKRENLGKQMKSVWEMGTPKKVEKRFGKHPTQKPLKLLIRIIQAASRPGDLVLDPFSGSGTTGIAATILDRKYIGIELNEEYLQIAKQRFLSKEDEISAVQEQLELLNPQSALVFKTKISDTTKVSEENIKSESKKDNKIVRNLRKNVKLAAKSVKKTKKSSSKNETELLNFPEK